MNAESLKNPGRWEAAGVALPDFDWDAMLKEDGVVHGCTCLEAGILLDIFTPMRKDFV